jgi:hypothetical protein
MLSDVLGHSYGDPVLHRFQRTGVKPRGGIAAEYLVHPGQAQQREFSKTVGI